eukprot:NODE_6475_length_1668_cov_7.036340.p1 GENE.NODE_6475_length_1668_cov_7.036340~~NODE_6475_length_1668_cov_7.036340.p1  ORF type:complete len:421 (+),score=143.04 NODE_6475_length_1668_cov_7.036340:227-1489(+)
MRNGTKPKPLAKPPKPSAADIVSSVRFDALLHLASRLDGLVERIRGTPIGTEIEEIAQCIRDEAGNFNVATVTDLANTISRISEEREELRRTLTQHLGAAVERSVQLQEECVRLRDEEAAAARALPQTVHSELSAALQMEADASRAARTDLLSELADHRSELAEERAERKTLKSELEAMIVLQRARERAEELGRSATEAARQQAMAAAEARAAAEVAARCSQAGFGGLNARELHGAARRDSAGSGGERPRSSVAASMVGLQGRALDFVRRDFQGEGAADAELTEAAAGGGVADLAASGSRIAGGTAIDGLPAAPVGALSLAAMGDYAGGVPAAAVATAMPGRPAGVAGALPGGVGALPPAPALTAPGAYAAPDAQQLPALPSAVPLPVAGAAQVADAAYLEQLAASLGQRVSGGCPKPVL